MRIAAVSYRAPSRTVSNEDVLDHLEAQNPQARRSSRKAYLNLVNKLFDKCGAKTRQWRDAAGEEKPADLILGAMDDALDRAGMTATDVDLLIYCGVGRGFLEPANAYFYAQARGMGSANCFDITDACMSWIRALQMAQLLLDGGHYRRAMIINGEFHMGFHDNWEIRDVRSLAHTFPMYTIGEAASATVLTATEPAQRREWRFDYVSRPELADLCTIPLEGYRDFVQPSERIGLNGVARFVSFGAELFTEGRSLLSNLIQQAIPDPASKRMFFPHAPSCAVYEQIAQASGIPADRTYLEVFPRFGNLVSASIPVGLSMAEAQGLLQRDDPIALIPASAGMVASVVQLTY
ncbi:MAG: 3-oxoacyl-[acyl-carrier-protein] synthase III C-terminal domain-containing protein [Planctomycetota bacterium]